MLSSRHHCSGWSPDEARSDLHFSFEQRDAFVKDLREALESVGLSTWADSRALTGGDRLTAEVETNIENARQFIVVVSLNALNSSWVQNEVKKALEVERRRRSDAYKVIPLMLPEFN